MKGITIRRPSGAMLVAVVALFVAMGGVGYAAATIGSAEIINNSVKGKDVRNNTLKGPDVNESTLGKVPSAAQADSAQSADNAQNAQSAANAGLLDGINSTGFLQQKPRLFEASQTAEIPNITNGQTVLTLPNLPAGQYLVTAKLSYDNDTVGGENPSCTLHVPGANDTAPFSVGSGDAEPDSEAVSLQEVVSSPGTFASSVSCTSNGDDDIDEVSIAAIALS